MANRANEKFCYGQLDLAKQQIRLVTIKPKSSNREEVECSIQVFDTDTAPPYVTLSYTWGPPTPTKFISLNGKHFVVRESLHNFLQFYQTDPSNTQFIWIDQICISQAHTGERNHQVRLMSHIYKQCTYVIVWLGVSAQWSAERFTMKPNASSGKWILRCSYFRRLWVIQEILLPREVRVLCGDVWLSWDTLKATIGPQKSQTDTCHLDTGMRILSLSINQRHSAGDLTLYDCLDCFSDQHCQDPRDKVHGLLGLVQVGQRLKVDYNRTTQQVFSGFLERHSLKRLAGCLSYVRQQPFHYQSQYGASEVQ
jgi:hypothetical protein